MGFAAKGAGRTQTTARWWTLRLVATRDENENRFLGKTEIKELTALGSMDIGGLVRKLLGAVLETKERATARPISG